MTRSSSEFSAALPSGKRSVGITLRWDVMLCALGNDLRAARCHVEHSCPALGCNAQGHYCDCQRFVVERVDGTGASA